METDESAIRRLEDERYDALLRGDITAFAAHCHSQLLYTHSSGGTDTLESYLAKLREGFYVYHSIDHPISQIVITDDVALVLGEMNADITTGGTEKRLHNKCLAVWVRNETSWSLLAYAPTPLGR
jgi:ketosteroid isomerase-like protein